MIPLPPQTELYYFYNEDARETAIQKWKSTFYLIG